MGACGRKVEVEEEGLGYSFPFSSLFSSRLLSYFLFSSLLSSSLPAPFISLSSSTLPMFPQCQVFYK